MTYDASSRKEVRKAEKEARQTALARLELLKSIMSTQAGRLWMLERLERCHVFATSFSADPLQMSFLEGERNIGLQDFSEIMNACPEQYVQMMHERNVKEQEHGRNSSPGSDAGSDDDSDLPGDDRAE